MPGTSRHDALDIADSIEFGPFRCLPSQHILLENGKQVHIGSRALEILIFLLEHAGEMCGKDEIMSRVWPGMFVDESNIRVHIAGLRKALNDGKNGRNYILNMPNRGYGFVAPITRQHGPDKSVPATTGHCWTHNVPSSLSRVIGRDEAIQTIAIEMGGRRLLTIIGPGGIGKTTVALAAAALLLPDFKEQVCFIDLSALTHDMVVARKVAAVLGVRTTTEDPIDTLVTFLRERTMLLVFDNCEHVIDSVAELVECLLRNAPHIKILTTSREALRAEGEYTFPLDPLGCPMQAPLQSIAAVLRYPAIELFIERAGARLDVTTLSDEDGAKLAEICRRLDGMPLAIELAAARVDSFGLRALAERLDDRFSLLTRGRRTALPRHQTLRATLDWSHDLLSPDDQTILRRLAIFVGFFTEEAARAVITDAMSSSSGSADLLANLIAQSLLSAQQFGTTYFRLLETTRAYAREKLEESGETDALLRRHAHYYRDLFELAEAEWETKSTADWLNLYGRKVDNLNAALTWAYGPKGDPSIGLALTVAAIPLWLQLSMVNDCRIWVELGLATLDAMPDAHSVVEKSLRMRLTAAMGWPRMYDATEGIEKGVTAWKTALTLAEDLDDKDYQLRALWALWADRVNHGACADALALAMRFRDLAAIAKDKNEQLIGERITGTALHFMGDQKAAHHHIKRMVDHYIAPDQRSHIVRYQFDQEATARMTLSRVLWVQGLVDQAEQEVHAAVERSKEVDHVFSLCNVLAQGACPVALLAGNLTAAEDFTHLLRRHTSAYSLDIWAAYADGFSGEILIRQGRIGEGVSLLSGAVDTLRHAGFIQYLTAFLAALAQGHQQAGDLAEGLAAIEEALAQCDATSERWCYAELLRIKGDLVLQGGNAKTAEECYRRSLCLASEQCALSWEARTGSSLATLLLAQNRRREAQAMLAPIYTRCSEGHKSIDRLRVEHLIEQMNACQHHDI